MKPAIYFVLTLVVLFLVAGAFLSLISRKQGAKGLVDGTLSACPETPNCVCSEYLDVPGYVAPLVFDGPASVAWKQAQLAITQTGGTITHVEESYLTATYSSNLFRFIDDVELRMDADAGVIHIRSASRVGYSDLGVNKRRISGIREAFGKLVSHRELASKSS